METTNPTSQPPRERLVGRAPVILTLLFLSQAALFYGFSRGEKVPAARSLSDFPRTLGPWHMRQEGIMPQEEKDVLQADDYINRFYTKAGSNVMAHLFVAFFRSQRTGAAPHSPKNCLPGNGWIWTVSDQIPIVVAGRAEPIRVNRYIIQKGDAKALSLYWYQSRERVVASEYTAKVFVVADALRYNRTDTSLVRVWVPMNERDDQTATNIATDFVQSFFATLHEYLPR
jgi:EpsI family protein